MKNKIKINLTSQLNTCACICYVIYYTKVILLLHVNYIDN